MAVAFDVNASGVETSAVGSLTITQTPGAGSDMILCATVGVHRSTKIMSTVVYDPTGENKSYIKFATVSNDYEGTIWRLLDADIINSTAKDTVFTPDANSRMAGNVASFTGVDQTTPLESAQTATGASVEALATPAITSGAGDITIDRLFTASTVSGLAADAGQTELQNVNAGLGYGASSYGSPAEATMGWTWSTSRDAGVVGCNIKSAGGGGGPTLKTASESIPTGLDETSGIKAIMLNADSMRTLIDGTSSIFVSLSIEESLALGMQESALLFITATSSDSLRIEVADDALIFSILSNLSDSLKVGIDELSSILDASFIQASESLAIGVIEDQSLLGVLARADSMNLGITEAVNIFNSFSVSESLGIGLAEEGSVFVSLSGTPDAVTVGITDASRTINIVITGADAMRVGLQELSGVLVSISRSEDLLVALTENINNLFVSVLSSDSNAVIFADAGTVVDLTTGLVSKTASEFLSIQILDVSTLSITETGIAGNRIIASVKLLSVRTVSLLVKNYDAVLLLD